jgi:hypothetical protein
VTAVPPDLPFLDEHHRFVRATPERTWAALDDYVVRLAGSSRSLLFLLLGTVPRSGFGIVRTDPPREVVLSGRHRFATYRLIFRVDAEGEHACLRALSYAAFPGLHGWAYRTALMVSTGHRRATQNMLRSVAHRAESGA